MKSVAIAVEKEPSSIAYRLVRMTGLVFLWSVLTLVTLWAAAALYVDCRVPALRILVTVVYVAAVLVVLVTAKGQLSRALLILVGFFLVLAWWLSLKPTNEADWQPTADHAGLAIPLSAFSSATTTMSRSRSKHVTKLASRTQPFSGSSGNTN